ncbi:MAG TPA: hypothetical protein VND54_09185 [Candidatus Saccharimonadales bacterium]|nr:hypothetical protein [Candidatus Saccharimonadales bacterium]
MVRKQTGRVLWVLPFLALGVVLAETGGTVSASTAPRLVASPLAVGISGDVIPPDDCTVGGTTFTATCHVTLSNPSSSSAGLVWSAQFTAPEATATPAGGTLAPGKSVKVTIVTNNCGDTWTFLATSTKGYAGLETGASVVYICG